MEQHPSDPVDTQPDHPQQRDGGPRVSRDAMRDLTRLRRHGSNRRVAGVAGGLGRHLDIDPVILRVAFVVLSFFGGAGLLLYGAAWLLVPEDGHESAVVDLDPRTRTYALLGAGVVGALMTIGDGWGFWGIPWPLVLIAAVVVFLMRKRDGGDTPAQPSAPPVPGAPGSVGTPGAMAAPATFGAPSATSAPGLSATGFVPGPAVPPPASGVPVGPPSASDPLEREGVSDAARQWYEQQPYAQAPFTAAPAPAPRPPNPRRRGPLLFFVALPVIALALGVLGIVDAAGAAVVPAAYPALALGLIGGLLLLGAWYGRAGGLILLGLVTAVTLAGTTAAGQIDQERIAAAPAAATDLAADYSVSTGEIVVDLTGIADPELLAGRELTLGAGAGRIEVIVPEGLDIDVEAQVHGAGSMRLLDQESGGIDIGLDRLIDDDPETDELRIVADLTLGEIVVRHP